MQLKSGIIIALAIGLSGCATSPFLVSREASYAPGFVPRNEMGDPVLPSAEDTAKARKKGKPATAPAPRQPSSWLNTPPAAPQDQSEA